MSLEFYVDMSAVKEITKTIGAIANPDAKARKDFKRAARRSATIGIKSVRDEIRNAKRPFVWKSKGTDSKTTSQVGQLKKSIKVWSISHSSFAVFLGVRRGQKAAGSDGWYAWLVEYGHAGGKDKSQSNKGFFDDGVRKVRDPITSALHKNLTRAYNRYLERLG
jgi:hypothetical protein